MLPRQHRLTKEKDFNKTFKMGRSCFGKILGVKGLKTNLKNARFGFVVANKVAKKANERNLAKRRLREIAHKHLKEIKPSHDYLVIALPALKDADFDQLEKEFVNCFKKCNFFNK